MEEFSKLHFLEHPNEYYVIAPAAV